MEALKLLEDLLRRFDAVGRVWRCGVGLGRLGIGRGIGAERGEGCGLSWGDGFGWLAWDGLRLYRTSYRAGVWLGGDFGGFGRVVEGGRVGIGWSGAAVAWSEDELGEAVVGALDEEHVAVGAIEECSEDLGGGAGSVGSKDTFVGDASGDLHGGLASDLAENLVEAGVAGRDGEEVIGEGNGSSLGWGPGGLGWRRGLGGGGSG